MPERVQSSASDLKTAKGLAKGEFLSIDGVEGVGIGDQCLRVYVRNRAVEQKLPHTFRGIPIELVITGSVTALQG